MALSKRVRFEILKRDDHACHYCGATAPDVVLHVDHVVPVALGGSDNPDNLVTACQGCNASTSVGSCCWRVSQRERPYLRRNATTAALSVSCSSAARA